MTRKVGFASLAMLIIACFLALGCTRTNNVSKTLTVLMDANNSPVYGNTAFEVYLDIDNQGTRTYRNLVANFFNTGSFTKLTSCSLGPVTLMPNGIITVPCKLSYDRDMQESIVERIDSSVSFESDYNAMIGFEAMTMQRYEEKKAAGTFSKLPTSSSYSNDEITVSMDLNENPVLVRNENRNFVYFTIKNTGSGFIDNLEGSRIAITSVPSGIITNCDTPALLFNDNNEFPKITCELSTSSVTGFTKVDVFINVGYTYEMRQKANIKVLR